MYQDVLVPTDGSDGTARAIDHGVNLARAFDATIHALSVVEDDADASTTGRAATRAVERVADEATAAGVDVVTATRPGTPHEEILAYADENDVDLTVMGTHGRTGVDRLVIGSVTERVVRNAEIPVLTIRMREELRVRDAEAAEEIATGAIEDAGYGPVESLSEPYRTSASWIVPAETDAGAVHVHVDAVDGDARVARLDR
ncbi:universal stress protein [Salinilacihabitans rarus]|uniref:universal stress protein n=1 Tax=Salinilacihabitans rarus TaxID=2961596 RepID=UPI0020C8D91B|nr:universal stress protein [Salinilacihabitans rarus]